MLVIKEAVYLGFWPPASSSIVRYIVLDNDVFFTATEDCSKVTSTINAAEQIIEAICKKEGLQWQNCRFYEIQTAIGYPWHGDDYLELDELQVVDQNGHPSVEEWQRVPVATKQQINSQAVALLANPVPDRP